VVPGVDYRLRAHPATKWGEWRLDRPSGQIGGDWWLHGPGFESGFGLGPVALSVAQWRGFLMVIKFLTEHDADPVAAIPLEEVTRLVDAKTAGGPEVSSEP
jgi:hypothetical protein